MRTRGKKAAVATAAVGWLWRSVQAGPPAVGCFEGPVAVVAAAVGGGGLWRSSSIISC